MSGLAQSVVTNQYEQAAQSWKAMLDIGDNLSILFFPYSDRVRRIEQFISENKKSQKDEYHRIFLQIDPLLLNIEEKSDLMDNIIKKLENKKIIHKKDSFEAVIKQLAVKKIQIVLIVLTADSLLLQSTKFFLAALHEILYENNPFIVSVCCFEVDITHPQYAAIFRQYPQLLHSIFYYPLYDKKDTEHFIKYVAKKWNVAMTHPQIDHLIATCGGKWWFIKDAVRQLRLQKSWNEDTDGMVYRKNMVIQSLLSSERSVLLKLLTGRKIFNEEEQHSINHLIKLRLISDDNHLLVPILRKPLLASVRSDHALTYENNMVYLNQVPIGSFFSRKEIRALKILVSQPGTIISRETLAQAIWPANTNANYSDWAIDQIIARVRKRLPEFEIPPASIKSIRGKGYMYIQL